MLTLLTLKQLPVVYYEHSHFADGKPKLRNSKKELLQPRTCQLHFGIIIIIFYHFSVSVLLQENGNR